jgi:hypothetical protein
VHRAAQSFTQLAAADRRLTVLDDIKYCISSERDVLNRVLRAPESTGCVTVGGIADLAEPKGGSRMDTISPVHADAFRPLLLDLYNHLCEAEDLASKTGRVVRRGHRIGPQADPRLLVGIRGLLIAHEITANGNCRTCPSVWPCGVVTTIHALVKDPDREVAAILRRANDDG